MHIYDHFKSKLMQNTNTEPIKINLNLLLSSKVSSKYHQDTTDENFLTPLTPPVFSLAAASSCFVCFCPVVAHVCHCRCFFSFMHLTPVKRDAVAPWRWVSPELTPSWFSPPGSCKNKPNVCRKTWTKGGKLLGHKQQLLLFKKYLYI